jgi:dimethylhistidine N-methyltransferase
MSAYAIPHELGFEFAAQVREGLTHPEQKELPSKYLYDNVGSALFEVICELPEYGLTRADERVLRKHAYEIVDQLPSKVVVAELGSGSGRKTRSILEALSTRQKTYYCPIEISPKALAICQRELNDIDSISIVGLEREYLDGLVEVAARRETDEHLFVLFLGSTIGNFDRPAGIKFLQDVRCALKPGDAMLLGTDLEKPIFQLLKAYDDPLGVTAAFNLNLLARINRELGANFALTNFRHVARFNEQARSVEMHLQSKLRQTVAIPASGITVKFDKGETIWTESSHKYRLSEIGQIAEGASFRCEAQWVDKEWAFAENLLIAI